MNARYLNAAFKRFLFKKFKIISSKSTGLINQCFSYQPEFFISRNTKTRELL